MERRTPTDFDTDLDALEEHLAGTLKHVSPPGELLQRLRDRIRIPAREEIVLRFRDWRKLFLVFGGVMSVLLVLITIARAFFYLARKHI